MSIKDNHINRYGEAHIRPVYPVYEDEYGMSRQEFSRAVDWSHDPRSQSSREKHFGKGPRGWPGDDIIKQKVSIALYYDPEVDARKIQVHVIDGIVMLEGYVSNRNQKKMAERCTEDISGVKDVMNKLVIRDFDLTRA
jgi:osmotically-inducible protein OsmY